MDIEFGTLSAIHALDDVLGSLGQSQYQANYQTTLHTPSVGPIWNGVAAPPVQSRGQYTQTETKTTISSAVQAVAVACSHSSQTEATRTVSVCTQTVGVETDRTIGCAQKLSVQDNASQTDNTKEEDDRVGHLEDRVLQLQNFLSDAFREVSEQRERNCRIELSSRLSSFFSTEDQSRLAICIEESDRRLGVLTVHAAVLRRGWTHAIEANATLVAKAVSVETAPTQLANDPPSELAQLLRDCEEALRDP